MTDLLNRVFPLPKGKRHQHTWVTGFISTMSPGLTITYEYCMKCEARR